MGIDILCLTIDWPTAVARYRENGLDFYWKAVQASNRRWEAAGRPMPIPPDFNELPGLPGSVDDDVWCGTRAFHLVSDFYEDAFRPALTDELRNVCEPVLPLLALWNEFPVPFDRQCLLTDSGLTDSPASDSTLYTLRPSTVREVLDAARPLSWDELDEYFEDPEDVNGRDISWFEGYDYLMLRSFAIQQLDRMRQAAERGHGVILILSV